MSDDFHGYMCPNCVTPWKCNGPHIPEERSMSADKFEEWWASGKEGPFCDAEGPFPVDDPHEFARLVWLASRKAALEAAAVSRIGFCDDGSLDEVVGSPGHLENLGDNHWFVTIGEYAIWLHSKSKITATYEHRPIRALIDKP